MTREELETMSYDKLIDICVNEIDQFTFYETLKDFAIEQVENDNLGLAIHILTSLHLNPSEYYLYDYFMGCMETPTPIDTYEELIDLILEQKGE